MCDAHFGQPRGRIIQLSEAIGTVLAHDVTEIRPGEHKGPAFKKGHRVTDQDLDHLERIGKRHLYVLDLPPGTLHEDDAALILAEALAGEGVEYNTNPSEGKITFKAALDGLLKIDAQTLLDFNMVEGVMCATRHTNTIVDRGEVIGGTRAIPLVIDKSVVEEAADTARRAGGVISVKPLARPVCGLIVTGDEVYYGKIQDKFVPVITPKLSAFGCRTLPPVFVPDDKELISKAVLELIGRGAELVVTTGGMSVDPDDVTRLGVQISGAEEILYGSAVLPGAMLLLAKVHGVPIIGVPACGMFHANTIFDLVLPRILAGETLTRRDLAGLGHGGLCMNCKVCRFPVCPFGKSA